MYPVDYNGVRVLTTEQLAAAYECEPNNIKKNFNANIEHFFVIGLSFLPESTRPNFTSMDSWPPAGRPFCVLRTC